MVKNLKKKKLQIVIREGINENTMNVYINGLKKFMEDSWLIREFPKGQKEIFCAELGYELGKRIKGISCNIYLAFGQRPLVKTSGLPKR